MKVGDMICFSILFIITELVLALNTGCAGTVGRYDPNMLNPTDERIRQLMATATAPPVDVPKFVVRVTKQLLLAGGSTEIVCLVPKSYGTGRIALGMLGNVSNRPLNQVENRLLVESVPCGSWEATCVIQTERGTERRGIVVKAFGDCNSGPDADIK